MVATELTISNTENPNAQKTIFNAANCFFERYISFGGLIEVALSLRTQFERESKTKSERAFALFLNKTKQNHLAKEIKEALAWHKILKNFDDKPQDFIELLNANKWSPAAAIKLAAYDERQKIMKVVGSQIEPTPQAIGELVKQDRPKKLELGDKWSDAYKNLLLNTLKLKSKNTKGRRKALTRSQFESIESSIIPINEENPLLVDDFVAELEDQYDSNINQLVSKSSQKRLLERVSETSGIFAMALLIGEGLNRFISLLYTPSLPKQITKEEYEREINKLKQQHDLELQNLKAEHQQQINNLKETMEIQYQKQLKDQNIKIKLEYEKQQKKLIEDLETKLFDKLSNQFLKQQKDLESQMGGNSNSAPIFTHEANSTQQATVEPLAENEIAKYSRAIVNQPTSQVFAQIKRTENSPKSKNFQTPKPGTFAGG
ncbi:MAG: hypothetical protein QNJ54_25735 [Prochloraceae cyanobacterium]|nr:hypothetical protein [Prochloraceae cyanobacterium]